MLFYKRPIKKKLLSLKILLTVLVGTIVFSIWAEITNLTYFTSICFIFFSLITVKGFEVDLENIIVDKFYFYGFIRQRKSFLKKNKIKIKSYGLDFGQNIDVNFDEAESPTGCLLSFLPFLISKNKITVKPFTIETVSQTGELILKENILLTEEEYEFVKTEAY